MVLLNISTFMAGLMQKEDNMDHPVLPAGQHITLWQQVKTFQDAAFSREESLQQKIRELENIIAMLQEELTQKGEDDSTTCTTSVDKDGVEEEPTSTAQEAAESDIICLRELTLMDNSTSKNDADESATTDALYTAEDNSACTEEPMPTQDLTLQDIDQETSTTNAQDDAANVPISQEEPMLLSQLTTQDTHRLNQLDLKDLAQSQGIPCREVQIGHHTVLEFGIDDGEQPVSNNQQESAHCDQEGFAPNTHEQCATITENSGNEHREQDIGECDGYQVFFIDPCGATSKPVSNEHDEVVWLAESLQHRIDQLEEEVITIPRLHATIESHRIELQEVYTQLEEREAEAGRLQQVLSQTQSRVVDLNVYRASSAINGPCAPNLPIPRASSNMEFFGGQLQSPYFASNDIPSTQPASMVSNTSLKRKRDQPGTSIQALSRQELRKMVNDIEKERDALRPKLKRPNGQQHQDHAKYLLKSLNKVRSEITKRNQGRTQIR